VLLQHAKQALWALESIVELSPAQDRNRLKEWALVSYYLNEVSNNRFSILVRNGTVKEHSFPSTAGIAAQQVLRYTVVDSSL